MKEGEYIKCPDCNSEIWTAKQATIEPRMPKQFLVDGYMQVNKIPGKSYCFCKNCGYMLPDMIDTPEVKIFTITLHPKKQDE